MAKAVPVQPRSRLIGDYPPRNCVSCNCNAPFRTCSICCTAINAIQRTQFGVPEPAVFVGSAQQEATMRSIAHYVLPVIVAASASGLMFSATLF